MNQESKEKSGQLLKEFNEHRRELERGWNPFLAPEDPKTYGRRLAQEIFEESSRKRG